MILQLYIAMDVKNPPFSDKKHFERQKYDCLDVMSHLNVIYSVHYEKLRHHIFNF